MSRLSKSRRKRELESFTQRKKELENGDKKVISYSIVRRKGAARHGREREELRSCLKAKTEKERK